MHVLSTWEGLNPSQFRQASRQELQKSGFVTFVDERIVNIERRHASEFRVTSWSGRYWLGRKLMLAPGVEFIYPKIPGYAENFPHKMRVQIFYNSSTNSDGKIDFIAFSLAASSSEGA